MPFVITNVYHQWNTWNSYSWVNKTLWPSNHPLCGYFRWYKYLNCRPWRTEYLFVTPLHNKRRATASRDNLWTRHRCQQPRTSTRNDVIPSVDASKVYFVTSLLTQYWLACKLTCTKRNFDTHQSVTDITAAIGTPWLHKLMARPCAYYR